MIPISSGRSYLRLTDLLLVRDDLLYFRRALVTWHLCSTFSEIVMATTLNVIKALLLKPLANKNAGEVRIFTSSPMTYYLGGNGHLQ